MPKRTAFLSWDLSSEIFSTCWQTHAEQERSWKLELQLDTLAYGLLVLSKETLGNLSQSKMTRVERRWLRRISGEQDSIIWLRFAGAMRRRLSLIFQELSRFPTILFSWMWATRLSMLIFWNHA